MDSTTSGVTTTLYIGSVEKITKADGSKEIKRYIGGVAIMTLALDTSGATQSSNTHYLYKDHLGSLDIITDAAGQIVQEQSFDAWGQRRDAVNWQDLLSAQLTGFNHSVTTRGFTGHEMLDEVGIIHMNGRIYDPKLGRFLQADPFIQEPTNTQSLNRYSYVLNNPLNATDPSGYGFIKKFASVIAGAIGFFVCGPSCAAIAVSAVTYAQTGSLKAALIAGISTYAFASIGGDFFTSGASIFSEAGAFFVGKMAVIGGITTVLQGGKFGHGFVSAGVTAFVAGAVAKGTRLGNTLKAGGRVVVRLVTAGTVSKLTGGKFANGAAYAAFSVAICSTVGAALNAAEGVSGNQASRQSEAAAQLSGMEKALRVVGGIFNAAVYAAKTIAIDVYALVVGQIGALWTLGENLWETGYNLFSGAPIRAGISLMSTIYNLIIPNYGLYGGAGWGMDQFGDDGLPRPLNSLDRANFLHDGDFNEAAWVKSGWFGGSGDLGPGPIGLAYKLLGTIPFGIKGAIDGEFKSGM